MICLVLILFLHWVFIYTIDVENEVLESNIKFKTDKIVTGIEYLGSGYDIVKANTIGDSNEGEDLGFRAPVIDFTWAQTDVGVTNSLEFLQPIGGWIRPKVSCGESENVLEIDSSSDFKNLLEASVSLDVKVPNLGTAAITTGYNQMIEEANKNKRKLYTNSYYCFTYAAGMPPSLDWETTDEFKKATRDLPSKLRDCTLEMYEKKSDECKDMEKWIAIFSEFGTHIATEVHLGGKLTRFLSAPLTSVKSLSDQGYNVRAVVGAALSGVDGTLELSVNGADKTAIENFKKSYKIRFSVLGGIHPAKNISESSILKWKASIPKSPMPIKSILTTLDTYLPDGYQYTYREALDFYIALNHALPWDIEAKNGNTFTLGKLLTNSIQVIGVDSEGRISAKCPYGRRILWGLILSFDDENNIKLTPCIQDRTSCQGMGIKNGMVWILCGNSLGLQFTIHTRNINDVGNDIGCKRGNVILTGFKASKIEMEGGYKFTSCNTGQEKCNDNNNNNDILWIVCVDDRLPGLNYAETIVNDGNIKHDNKNIKSGFNGCLNNLSWQFKLCNRFIYECKILNECKYSFSWGLFI